MCEKQSNLMVTRKEEEENKNNACLLHFYNSQNRNIQRGEKIEQRIFRKAQILKNAISRSLSDCCLVSILFLRFCFCLSFYLFICRVAIVVAAAAASVLLCCLVSSSNFDVINGTLTNRTTILPFSNEIRTKRFNYYMTVIYYTQF